MNLVPRPEGNDDRAEPFVPDFSEGAETGLYLALLELLDEGLVITGDETILEVNTAACRLLERDYRQLAGKPLADLFLTERAFLEARARLFIQGEMRGSLQVSLPGGRHRNLRFIAAARIRPGIHALILSPDLLAEAYAEAPPTDTLWPRLAAALDQPVIVVDDDGQVAAANAAALHTLGVARAKLVGRPLESCLRVTWPDAGGAPIARLAATDGANALEARVLPGPRPDWRLLILPPAGGAALPAADKRPAPSPAAPPAAAEGAPQKAATAASAPRFSAAALRHALASDELELHFQPLIDARDGGIRGGEALLRWRHPKLGLIPFATFMDAARDSGMFAALGDWAVGAACMAAAQWAPIDGRLPLLTVNVAIEQAVREGFAGVVGDALAASGLPAAQLELDLEERVLEADDPRIGPTLAALAALGVRLAVDGFGQGLASIPKLKRYPLRALKLDPALVREVGTREDSEAIVEAITTMAGVLGLQVLARGVESAAQQAFLGALGCHLQQGPLFGRPIAAEAFRRYLAGKRG